MASGHKARCWALLAALSLAALGTAAEETAVQFRTLADFTKAKVELANGEFPPEDWPTFVIAVVGQELAPDGTTKPITCTAVFVGEGVLLTAAHCFDQGPGKPLITHVALQIGGQTLQGDCSVSSEYARTFEYPEQWDFVKPRVVQDYAVCALALPAVMPAVLKSMRFEIVDASTPVASGTTVLMSGYGCAGLVINGTQITGSNYDEKLRIKEVLVSRVPTYTSYSESFVTIVSRPQDQPALCPGDSGGPLLSGTRLNDALAPRRIRAVNSRLEFEPGQLATPKLASKFAPIGTQSFLAFVQKWTTSKGRSICGINAPAGVPPCRD